MSLGKPVNIRLSLEKQWFYEREAERLSMPLSKYLRQRIEMEDVMVKRFADLEQEVMALRCLVEELTEDASGSSSNSRQRGLQIETLMLLRQLATPEQRREVRSEMHRLGVGSWSPDSEE